MVSTLDQALAQGRAAFLWACGLDVAVRKPGNVSLVSDGHAMHAEQFLVSARAAVDPLFARGAPVGARIEAAVAATRAAVGCNTNLGIVLLCAPIAAALESGLPSLRAAVRGVLARLDVDDACAAYRGILLANPGGLGRVENEDVSAPPAVDLRVAMALAADRDSVARQYAEDYADIFGAGFAALAASRGRLADAVQALFVGFLAGRPDSHIVRKHGAGVAQSVTTEAAAWRARLADEPAAGDSDAFVQWDESLKAAGINPGTTADLTVCTLFAAALTRPGLIGMRPGESWHGSCIEHAGIGPIPTSDVVHPFLEEGTVKSKGAQHNGKNRSHAGG